MRLLVTIDGDLRGVEIRCVPEKEDGWEAVSSRGCCMFEWVREGQHGGILYVESHHCRTCVSELFMYAACRGYIVRDKLPSYRALGPTRI